MNHPSHQRYLAVKLRKARKTDWDFILKLRNYEEYRRFFYIQNHTINKKEHYSYMEKQQKNRHFFHWIICYNNKDAGYVRILENDVGIIVDKKFLGKGIGSRALELLEKEAKKLGVKKLVAKIMVGNKTSKQIFVKNDYNLKMYWYEKKLE